MTLRLRKRKEWWSGRRNAGGEALARLSLLCSDAV